MNLSEAAKLVAVAVAVYPSYQERDMEPTAKAWLFVLGHLAYDVGQAALARVLATSRFFPTPAEILEAAGTIMHPGLPSGEEAWEEVRRQIRLVGWCGTPTFSAQLISRTVDAMGGWNSLCASEEPAGVDRAHFMRIYDSLARRERQDAQMPPVVRELAERLAAKLALPETGGPEGGGQP